VEIENLSKSISINPNFPEFYIIYEFYAFKKDYESIIKAKENLGLYLKKIPNNQLHIRFLYQIYSHYLKDSNWNEQKLLLHECYQKFNPNIKQDYFDVTQITNFQDYINRLKNLLLKIEKELKYENDIISINDLVDYRGKFFEELYSGPISSFIKFYFDDNVYSSLFENRDSENYLNFTEEESRILFFIVAFKLHETMSLGTSKFTINFYF